MLYLTIAIEPDAPLKRRRGKKWAAAPDRIRMHEPISLDGSCPTPALAEACRRVVDTIAVDLEDMDVRPGPSCSCQPGSLCIAHALKLAVRDARRSQARMFGGREGAAPRKCEMCGSKKLKAGEPDNEDDKDRECLDCGWTTAAKRLAERKRYPRKRSGRRG